MAGDLEDELISEMKRVGAKERPGQPMLPEKLCAYEAGLGVYGRSGLILHPELGNRTWMLHPVHCELAQSLAPGEGWPDDH